MVIPRSLRKDTRVRAFKIWLGVRVGLVTFGAFVGLPIAGPVTFVWVVALAVLMVQADVRVCREAVLIANLGVSNRQLLRLAFPLVLFPEVILQGALLPVLLL